MPIWRLKFFGCTILKPVRICYYVCIPCAWGTPLRKAARKTEASLGEEHRHVEELLENLETLQQDSEIALQNERQTVTILVNEKTHLSAELQKREHYESRVCLSWIVSVWQLISFSRPDAKAVEDLLEAERVKADDFSNEIQKLQKDVQALSEQAQQSLEKEKALAERCKEQVILLSFPFHWSLSSSPLSGTATSICHCIR